ncbi:response regulator transcription factor [soil metagenome]
MRGRRFVSSRWHPHLFQGAHVIKIGIVDDHAIVRTALKQFFSEQVDLRVTGEAANGQEALDLVRGPAEMDVLVMDLHMPGSKGIEAVVAVREAAPAIGILVLTGYPESHHAANLVRLGVSGYLNKDCSPAEIVDAVRIIALGRRVLSPAVKDLMARQLERKVEGPPHDMLSAREMQVFLKLAQGTKLGVVADELGVSVKTASTYRNRILAKLDMTSNSQLTFYAFANKLID